MEKNKKNNKNSVFGIFIILIGIITISYDYINSKITYAYDEMSVKLIDSNELVISDNIEANNDIVIAPIEEEIEAEPQAEAPVQTTATYNYIGYLEIPTLKLKKGFLEIGNKYNTVNKNVTVLKESDMPDVENGNFILASHSGNSSVAFFTNLYKLKKGDTVYITYNSGKYTYQIVDIYNQPKTGTLSIYTEKNKTHLTLITCTYGDKTAQTIYIAELVSVE